MHEFVTVEHVAVGLHRARHVRGSMQVELRALLPVVERVVGVVEAAAKIPRVYAVRIAVGSSLLAGGVPELWVDQSAVVRVLEVVGAREGGVHQPVALRDRGTRAAGEGLARRVALEGPDRVGILVLNPGQEFETA